MAVSDYSVVADENVSISGINIAEQCPPGNVNDAFRQLMADIKNVVTKLESSDKTLQESMTSMLSSLTDSVKPYLVPSGTICLWHGSTSNIPAGWYLCNGANGTPDLRNRFVVGAGSAYSPGKTGGATSHSHGNSAKTNGATLSTGQLAAHNHYLGWSCAHGGSWYSGTSWLADFNTGRPNTAQRWTGDACSSGSHSHGVAVTINSADSRPPYYALCFIMKG